MVGVEFVHPVIGALECFDDFLVMHYFIMAELVPALLFACIIYAVLKRNKKTTPAKHKK